MRQLGMLAAFAAVHAFVFNALIAGFLLAAIPAAAYASDYEICSHSVGGEGIAADANGPAKKAALHCKLCLPALAAAILPPPQPMPAERVVVTAPRQAAFDLRLRQFSRFRPFAPRGPPAEI
ncbi:DUF2946 family protein [Bradyrhizobium sp. WD16]|uniref:DUF2946 family protein n=1 Tax=Bradyrhizobium sp. WD16 TaxID=1521768 RepID=UPI0020A33DB4|nr:DUF2946 family protein [Bradyrhizobium sp. WD16]